MIRPVIVLGTIISAVLLLGQGPSAVPAAPASAQHIPLSEPQREG